MIQGVQANSQHLSGFFTLNQFIHHQNSLPFGICLVFFSLPVPNIISKLHFHSFINSAHLSLTYLAEIPNYTGLITCKSSCSANTIEDLATALL